MINKNDLMDRILKVNHELNNVRSLIQLLNNQSAVIPTGKYKGRWGKIVNTIITIDTNDELEILCLILPYNLKEKDGSVIEDNYSRTYIDFFLIETMEFDVIIESKLREENYHE